MVGAFSKMASHGRWAQPAVILLTLALLRCEGFDCAAAVEAPPTRPEAASSIQRDHAVPPAATVVNTTGHHGSLSHHADECAIARLTLSQIGKRAEPASAVIALTGAVVFAYSGARLLPRCRPNQTVSSNVPRSLLQVWRL